MYKVVALAGKAGSGKDTILKRVIAAAPDLFHEIISCTSRPMREGEREGVNYFYFTPPQFKSMVQSGDMLEWTEFNNWFYGTPKKALVEDKVNIGVFNPAGLESLVLLDYIDLSIISIECDDKQRLLRQLNRETSPDVHEIIRRFGTDEHDFERFRARFPRASYVYNSYPGDLDDAVQFIVGETREPDGQIRLRYSV